MKGKNNFEVSRDERGWLVKSADGPRDPHEESCLNARYTSEANAQGMADALRLRRERLVRKI